MKLISLIALLFFSYLLPTHDSNIAHFKITSDKNYTIVEAEFTWSIRNAVFKFAPHLENQATKATIQKALEEYITENLVLSSSSNGRLKLKSVKEIKTSKGHSHQINYQITFEGSRFDRITNTMLINVNSKQTNYHTFLGKEYITTNDTISFNVESPKNNTYYWFYSIGLVLLIFLFNFIRKKHRMQKLLCLSVIICLTLGSCSKKSEVSSAPTSPTSVSTPTSTTPPPSIKTNTNILLIIADDLGLDATPNYNIGAKKPAMPNLGKMISNGITFDNFWAYPVCSPTRASILTGKYGVRTGVLNAEDASTINANEKIIQSYLDENLGKVYSHSIIGKWHLSNNEPNRPTEMGVDYYAGLLGGGVQDYYQWRLIENGQGTQSTDYITTKLTDLAIDWIKNQDKPWFCWLAYTTPHTPFHLPPANMHSQGSLATDQASIDANPLPYYLAMVESLDFEIGRLLATIPADELENTVIIFIGDNGTPNQVVQSPYESSKSKGSIYQGGINTPLVVSGKGVDRKGVRDASLVSTVDLFSTIGQIAGISENSHENSMSFYPLFSGDKFDRTYNYSELLNVSSPAKSGYTIRNDTYKLIVFDNGNERFYNLKDDMFEATNLLNRNLSTDAQAAYNSLKAEVSTIRK